ncbi:MAG: hypothetical protein GY801_21925, partial [bacterium]|nr:hypothetical protein [bacterium]
MKPLTDTHTIPSLGNVSKEDYINAERIRRSYAQLPLGVIGTLVNALVLSFALLPVTSPLHIGLWMAGVITVSCLRLGQYAWYKKKGGRIEQVNTWKRLFYANLLAAGMVWGMAAIVL